jgi:hypothetical protein
MELPELLSLNNSRIKHRFEELFDIIGTSATDSLAAGEGESECRSSGGGGSLLAHGGADPPSTLA